MEIGFFFFKPVFSLSRIKERQTPVGRGDLGGGLSKQCDPKIS